MKYAILLDERKAPQVIEFTAEQEGLDYYYKAIDCDTIDIVHTQIKNACLVVDDEGLLKEKPLNLAASVLYGIARHGQPIVGAALLTAEEATPNGLECVGFEKHVAEALANAIKTAVQPLKDIV